MYQNGGPRNPTKQEIEIAVSLQRWLDEHQAKILSQTQSGKGRWQTVYSTSQGCVIVTVTHNRVAAIAAQIPHDNVGLMLHTLDNWSR
jgi:hypothetical protein